MNDKSDLLSTSQKKRPSIVNVAQMITMLSIALFALSLIVFALVSKYNEQKQRALEMRASYVDLQKDITRREVERVVASINERRGNSRQIAISKAKERAYQAYAIAENIYNTFKDTKSQSEVLETILSALRPVRFDQGNGYYFVDTLDGRVLLVAGRPEIEGKHYSTFESQKDQAILADLIDMAKRKEEGIFEYKWAMPGKQGEDHHKISYLKLFKPYNLIIGTGLYLEDVEAVTKRELKEEISNIKYGANGYFFINDFQGNILAHGDQAELVGANNWEYTDSRGNKLFQDLRQAVKNPKGGFCYYWWRMPETGKERPKIAFAKAVPEWEWLIGTGVYLDNVDADVKEMQAQLRARSIREVSLILLVTGAIIALVYVIMGMLFRPLRRDIGFFNDCFALASRQDISIDEDKIKFIELLKIAENANKMLREKALFLQKLHEDKQQLFVTLQSITDAVIATNRLHEIVLLNTVAEQMINCPREKAIGKPLPEVLSFFDGQTRKPVDCPIQAPLEEELSITLPEHIHLINQSGRKYNVEIVASPIANKEDIAQGIIVVFRDITERIKVQEERLRLKKLESVGVLAGGIAHDFNNLLTSLIGNIDLAKMQIKPSSPAYRHISRAESAMESAKNLATQLLTFAKGGKPVKKVLALKDELTSAAEFNLRGSKIQLESHIAEDLLPVEADLGQINQVISNLIINSQQAMPDGGKIVLRAENEGREWVLITITDQGPGIPADIQDNIFDPYFTTKDHGSGLGLASCHSIISNHGGSIEVESKTGEGASFIIKLPASRKALPDKSAERDEEDIAAYKDLPARILVVDDMDDIRTLIEGVLNQFGYETEGVGDAVDAWDKYIHAIKEQNPFDLVITDLIIPGGEGGEEIVKWILEIDPEARVIVSSGYSDSPIVANYKEYGFAAYIAKPYRVNSIINTVREVLRYPAQP